jgi:hypothetical protein
MIQAAMCIATMWASVALTQEAEPKVELLPKTPAGWKFERIEFPLPFAPSLKYSGFEELRFAPGMFNAAAPDYFSYIFAIKVHDDISMDQVMLKQFLETYYRGLCESVARGGGFELDLSIVKADVTPDSKNKDQFKAKLRAYDAFVTRKPFDLYLDIVTRKVGSKDHRLFAAVSPKPRTDPVWKTLLELKKAFEKQTPAAL